MAGWKRFVSLLVLVLVMVGNALPVMAAEIDSQEFKQQKLKFMFVKLLWENWPHKDSGYEIKWGGSTHKTIAGEVGRAMGIGDPYLTTFREYSVKPDEEDSMWWPPWCPDRLCKHVYDPELHFGSAPQACSEKAWDAISNYRQGKLREAYQELGRAAHYLMDVGNPYHSNLEGDPHTNKLKHDFYEKYVEGNIQKLGLDTIAYSAPKITITNPYTAVEELASFSRMYKYSLDSAIGVRCNFYDPTGVCLEWEAYAVDEALIKMVAKTMIQKTAGYTKGLIEYFERNN
ncbi:phospholipase C/P1 nuclease family protein [Archaeoglobus neptunius]|uniref:hypothetical protein n=1 Tax=Archaeoglobus neptunius TaxID=2798580 RepID=UPI0019263F0A|nr:hypothetical protein [Archaeoglobus neptunius]